MSDVLSRDAISKAFNLHESVFDTLSVFEHIDSTNDWCLQQCRSNKTLPFACIANIQDKGKGRRGHHWVSAPGSSITMSFATTFDMASNQLGMLSMAMGMAVVDVLRGLNINNVMLKWPNDILVNQQKIAGILIETVNANNRLNVVIGIGLNYDILRGGVTDFQSSWTDVCQSLGAESEGGRNQLAAKLLQQCLVMCERYQQSYHSLSVEFDARYNAYINDVVVVLENNGTRVEGICLGTTKQGELRVLSGETEQVFNSAEISLRKATEC